VQRHKETLKELSILGLPYYADHHAILADILESPKLTKIELEIGLLMEDQNTLEAIENGKSWSQIEFIDSLKDDESEIKDIIRHHPRVRTIKFTQKSPVPLRLTTLNKISHLEVAIFDFKDDAPRSFTNLANLSKLVISRLNNEYQLSQLIEQLRLAPNLRVLRIKNLSSRACTDRKMRQIVTAVKSLEELHLEAYSKHFDITADALEIIKNEAMCLRKLSVAVAEEKLEHLREKLRIFNFTKVRAVGVVKKIYNTCLESASVLWEGDDDIEGNVRFLR
jgi:hypothetical protein